MNRPVLIGVGGLAVIVVAVLALSRHRDAGKLPPAAETASETGTTALAAKAGPKPENTEVASVPRPVGAAAEAPSFDVVRVGPQGQTVIAGRAAPGAEVTVHDGATVVGRVTADSRGEWVLVPETNLPPGHRSLSLSAQGPGGTAAQTSSGDVLIAVPEPSRNVAGQPAEGTSSALALLVPRGGAVARPLQVPSPNPGKPGAGAGRAGGSQALALDIIEYGAAGRIELGGRADPGAKLNIYLGDKLIDRAQAGGDGKWSATPEGDVAPGLYQLRIDQIRRDGKVTSRLALSFERAAPTQVLAKGEGFIVQPGNSLWRIARQSYGAGVRYAVIYGANRNQIADPNLIYPGQVFKLPGN